MDQNDWRIAVTVVSFIVFIAILFWAFGRKAKSGFDVASRIPFESLEEARQDESMHNVAQAAQAAHAPRS